MGEKQKTERKLNWEKRVHKEKNLRFLLNMQMIIDEFENRNLQFFCSAGDDRCRLTHAGFYHGQEELLYNCVYLAMAEQLPEKLSFHHTVSLIVIGEPPSGYYYGNFSIVSIPEKADLFSVFEIVQTVFERNRSWDAQLLHILNRNGSIQELCEAAYDYFQNPLFIHNPQFYIIACPVHQDNMDPWQEDARTGARMLSVDLINMFKTSTVYFDTLDTEGAQIFPKDQVGHRVLYINLWNDFGRYEGRICIDELNTTLKKGQFAALEYFAGLVQMLLQRRNPDERSMIRPMEDFFTGVISGKISEERQITSMLETCGWDMEDAYVCFKLELENRDHRLLSMVNTCNHIEATLQECYAFFYKNSILVILNLTKNRSELTECTKSLTYIIREGLLKMGISNVFHWFSNAPYGYMQASLALHYGTISQPTIWTHRYQDYVMDYIFDMACREMPAEFICSDKLLILKRYDEENQTDLFETLSIYMKNGQNAEQTARELFLHRSTLFYRLKKIRTLTGIDWTSESERTYLQFSLDLLEYRKHFPRQAGSELHAD